MGNTGIEVSKIGIGTGTSGFTGVCMQAQMSMTELGSLLLRGFELGINLWDTAYTYGTYPHIKYALKSIKREEIVISSKTNHVDYKNALKVVELSLSALNTDYIDIFYLHGVRNIFDFRIRRGALKALLKCKEAGYIRAVGFSSHGIGAIEGAINMKEIDVVMARLNYTGDHMDSYQEGFLPKLISIPIAHKVANAIIPRRILPSVSKLIEPSKSSMPLQGKVKVLLKGLHDAGKGIIGIKLLGAGKLKTHPDRAISFAKSLPFVHSYVIGITNEDELIKNISLFNS